MCLLVGVGNAWADDVTFTFKTDEDITYTKTGTSGGSTTDGECIVSKDDVTLVGTNAYTEAAKSLSVYAKSTLTITAPGNITAVELEYNGKVYPFDEAVGDGKKGEKFAASGAHAATYAPTTPSTSVTLTNPNNGKTELLSLKVTYVAGSAVKVTGVSLDTTSKTLTEGETFTLTATVAPADASNKLITWSSSDETVAKVDKNGEVVSVAPGTATITVKTVDGNYTASCAVTVIAAPEPDEYVFLFAPAGSDGDSSTAVSTANLNKAFAEGYQYISSITVDKVYPARNSLGYGVKFGSSSAAGTITINLKKPVKATYIVVSAAPYGDTEGQTGFTINGQEVSMKNGKNKVYEEYVVKLDGSDLSTITLTQKQANKGRIYVEYIKLVKDDAYYAEKSLTFAANGVYNGYPCYFATFSSDKDVFIPGTDFDTYEASVATVVTEEDHESLVLMPLDDANYVEEIEIGGKTYYGGYYVPANTGVLLAGMFIDGTTMPYFEVSGVEIEAIDAEFNMLRPASVAKETDGSYKFYKLAYEDSTMDPASLGFYWGAANGGAFDSREGSAYLAVPADQANAKGFRFVVDDNATAIKNVDNKVQTNAVYNLAGQRVASKDFKGIVIKNGKKMLNK